MQSQMKRSWHLYYPAIGENQFIVELVFKFNFERSRFVSAVDRLRRERIVREFVFGCIGFSFVFRVVATETKFVVYITVDREFAHES